MEGGYFQGEGQEKILMCKGSHYMKNKNIGGCVLSTQLDQQKRPLRKNAQKMQKKISIIEKFSSLVSLTRHFIKFIFLEQLTAMPQLNMQNIFFFFFLSSHYDTNPLLHLYHFRKNIIMYWLILTVNNQVSYFPFFVFIEWVKHSCTQANFVTI